MLYCPGSLEPVCPRALGFPLYIALMFQFCGPPYTRWSQGFLRLSLNLDEPRVWVFEGSLTLLSSQSSGSILKERCLWVFALKAEQALHCQMTSELMRHPDEHGCKVGYLSDKNSTSQSLHLTKIHQGCESGTHGIVQLLKVCRVCLLAKWTSRNCMAYMGWFPLRIVRLSYYQALRKGNWSGASGSFFPRYVVSWATEYVASASLWFFSFGFGVWDRTSWISYSSKAHPIPSISRFYAGTTT